MSISTQEYILPAASKSICGMRREQQFAPTAKMTTVMDPDLKLRLKRYCNATRQSAASVLDRLIRTELARWEE